MDADSLSRARDYAISRGTLYIYASTEERETALGFIKWKTSCWVATNMMQLIIMISLVDGEEEGRGRKSLYFVSSGLI